jgi:tetratricopeptide (TPR) repeat protein
MTEDIDVMLKDGISACKAGRREEARDLLMQVVEIDENNEDAWLWLSGAMDNEEDQIKCLENVLILNPDNQNAKNGLAHLQMKQGKNQPASPSPFTDLESDWTDFEAGQDFLADLGIEEPAESATYQSGYEDTFDKAIFAEDDYDPLGDENTLDTLDDDYADPSDRFEALMGDSQQPRKSTPTDYASKPDPFVDPVADDDDGFVQMDDEPYYADTQYDEQPLEDMTYEADDESSYDEIGYGYGSSQNYDEDDATELSLDVYFQMIPERIRATRPPGVDEGHSPLLIGSLGLLLVGNIAMIAWLALNMMG